MRPALIAALLCAPCAWLACVGEPSWADTLHDVACAIGGGFVGGFIGAFFVNRIVLPLMDLAVDRHVERWR